MQAATIEMCCLKHFIWSGTNTNSSQIHRTICTLWSIIWWTLYTLCPAIATKNEACECEPMNKNRRLSTLNNFSKSDKPSELNTAAPTTMLSTSENETKTKIVYATTKTYAVDVICCWPYSNFKWMFVAVREWMSSYVVIWSVFFLDGLLLSWNCFIFLFQIVNQ